MKDDMNDEVKIIYDGECPLCRNYWKYIRLKETVGTLHLVDAREPSPIMDEITQMGLDIDEGIAVKIDNKIYYGSDAINVVSLLTSKSGWLNKISYHVFKSPTASRIIYPMCKKVRKLVLWVMRVEKIKNLEKL